jgi:hypothetical protein
MDIFQGNSSKFLIYTVGFIIPFVTLGVANLAMYLKVTSVAELQPQSFSKCVFLKFYSRLYHIVQNKIIKNILLDIYGAETASFSLAYSA